MKGKEPVGSANWWPQRTWVGISISVEATSTELETSSADSNAVVSPFTLEHLYRVITDAGYTCEYDVAEPLVHGFWNDLEFYFTVSPCASWLGISSIWEPSPDLPAEIGSFCLQEVCNEWNRLYLQPAAYPSAPEQMTNTITLHYSAFVGAGASDAQLLACLHRALDVSLQAHHQLQQIVLHAG